eukprot:9816902-Alexandrium_andersonii.AAC.1
MCVHQWVAACGSMPDHEGDSAYCAQCYRKTLAHSVSSAVRPSKHLESSGELLEVQKAPGP